MLQLLRDIHRPTSCSMNDIPRSYFYNLLLVWVSVSADQSPGRPANATSDTADPRSPIGRVPPFPPQGVDTAVVYPGAGHRPFGYGNARVPPWQHHTVYDKDSSVIAENYDTEDDGLCREQCKEEEFFCQITCICISMSSRCDGIPDCTEEEDEQGCVSHCDLQPNRTLCHNSNLCIRTSWLCDGDNDCGDFSDETHCRGSAQCSPEEYVCDNGWCIHKEWVCDGDNDCRDNSDELNCTKAKCRDNQFTCADGNCIALHWRCDREPDCPDKSDEDNTCPIDLIRCGEHEYQCNNKKCIPKEFKCDGDNDCGDWTDEDMCPMTPGSCSAGEFKCNDGKCIPERWRCDAQWDCTDGGDELNCDGTKHNCSIDEHQCKDKKCVLKTWLCDGVPDCSGGEDEMNCTVNCEQDQYTCKSQEHLISNAFRNCVNRKHVCDGMKDCPRGDDEEDCPTERVCRPEDKCKGYCVTTFDGKDGCACPSGYMLDQDGFSCQDIDECRYEQDPACSQTCSNTVGSFKCGCMTGYVLRPDERSCKAIGGSPFLLFSNRIGIRQVWLTGDNYVPVIKGLHNAVALDYHYEKKLLFWTENNLKVIRVAEMNSNNISDVIKWGLETPGGVAVDWIHNLLFWTDSGTRRVEVANLDGSLRAVIAASDLDKPRAIAVHPGDAIIFWSDWGPNPKIERADMDGSQRKSVIDKRIYWPNGLTIDYTESTIYWADAKLHVIEKATFSGRERKVITNKGLPHPFALTIFEDAIYWTDWHTKSISTVNKKTGLGIQSVHAELHAPMDIHSYHPLRQMKSYTNRCEFRNGGCSHLCLPNSGGYSCRCPIGFNLGADGRTCHDNPDELLLYARKKDIRLKQLYPKKPMDSLDMVIPVDNIKSAVALDWDYKTNSIFWTDVEKDTINRAYLNGSNHVVIVSSNLISPCGISYDWLTNKIYWTDAGTNRIEVANSDGTMRTVLAWDKIDKPRDIVVEPRDGVMYWSDWGLSPCIEKADMDGQNRRILISGKMMWPNGLALDYKAKRIYWTDGGNRSIEYANFDGTGRAVLIASPHINLSGDDLPHPFGLDLYGDEIFWTDWETHSIQAANKMTGKGRRTLGAGAADLMDVTIYHNDRTNIAYHECFVNNGGCSHICLVKPQGRTCNCPTGVSLKADRKTCISAPTNFLVFSHRIDIRFVSLDTPYLIDVVLPLPPIKHALGLDFDKSTGLLYWTDTAERKILRANLTGGQNETVIGKSLHTVDGVAIDASGRKIYWTDGGRNSIEVAELDGSNRKVLIWTGLDSPRAITLYYEIGIMFWTDWGSEAKIERADMDGTKRKVIIDKDIKWPNGLAVDRLMARIYWSDAQMLTIESSNFDGHNRKAILQNVPYPYGIAIVGQHMYWTDWKNKSLQRADKETGSYKLVIRKHLEGLMDIRAVQGNERLPPNACRDNNGLCSHLCLRNSMNSHSCACPTGLLFEEGQDINRKCKRHPDNFLVFATTGSVAYISLDTPELWDVTMPIKDVQHSIAVDFHWDNGLIFFSDVNKNVIRSVNMSNMSESKVVIQGKIDTPNGLGVDWIANNIYWTDNEYKVLEVARLDGSSRRTLISGLAEPRALALFPAKGYLYWSDWGKSPYIERAYLDGSSRKTIASKDLGFPNGLTIDYRQRKLYWTDALKDRIDVANLDGTHRMQLVPDAKNPFGMTLFNDYIYWTDWYKKAVMRADKTTGKNVTAIRTDLEMAMEIKMVTVERQHGWNPCKEENGGCSHLCLFRKHNYICACPDDPDAKPCSADPTAKVDMKMPPHYPSFYDYTDEETDGINIPRPKATETSDLSVMLIGFLIASLLFIVIGIAVYFYAYRGNDGGRELKESFRNTDGRFSFHNPNYAAGSSAIGDPDRRTRFQGIFKYDKSQEKVTNVYIPEGTSLLPPPPPPPRDVTPHRSTRDNFEPVTLHTYA